VNTVLRAIAMLVNPAAAWERIEKESGDAVYLLTTYVALLALIPAVSGFIGDCLVGVVVPGRGSVRVPIGDGLLAAVFGYVATFAEVLVVVLLFEGLARLFSA